MNATKTRLTNDQRAKVRGTLAQYLVNMGLDESTAVAAVTRGNGVKVKGGLGSVLVLVEEREDNYDIAAWKAFRVDGKKYKADTWYALKNGKAVEA